MNPDHSVQAAEQGASETLFPELKAHLNYVNDVYNLAFVIQQSIAGKKLSEISDVARAQFMILMRLTDFLRCIQLLTIKGYPEQAGTLAASVYELAHIAAFFSHSPDKVKTWLEANSIKQQMPKKIPGGNWKDLVKANSEHLGDGTRTEAEYQVYQQLCWMKHSLPKMQDMRVEHDGVSLVFGPHTDERAISHAWFALEHAGRLTELVIAQLIDQYGSSEAKADLQAASERRFDLTKLGIERFGNENPFESERQM